MFKWKFNRKNILSSLTYEYYFFEGSGNYKDEIIKKYFNVYFINGKCKEITFKLLFTYFVCDDDISFDKDKKTFGVYTIKDHIKIPYSIIIIIILSLTL